MNSRNPGRRKKSRAAGAGRRGARSASAADTPLALEKSEKRFRAMIEMATDLVVVLDAKGTVTYASPSIKVVGGYEASEIVGRNFLEFVHPEDARSAADIFAELLHRPETSQSSEWRYRHKNGEWRAMQASSRNLLDDSAVAGIIVRGRDVTESRRAEADMEFNNTILATQLETSLDAILVVDENATIASYNSQFVDLWRVAKELLRFGKDDPVLQRVVEQVEDPDSFLAKIKYLYAHKDEKSQDQLRLKDGRVIDRYSAPMVAMGGRYLGRVWYFRDVTQRKAAEERIRALNVLYVTLSGINHAIVQSTSRRGLCQALCDTVTRSGTWLGAWVGFVDDATQRIVPEAWSGSMVPFIDRMVVSVDPAVPEGRGPTGTSARTGAPYFCNDVFADPATLPWRPFAKAFGANSVAAVPIRLGNAFAGVINLYSGQTGLYTPEIQSLMVELGGDIAFALQGLKSESLRRTTENTLVESEAKFRALVEQNISGIYIIQDEKLVYVNPWFAEIFGYDPRELPGKPIRELVAGPDRAMVLENIREQAKGALESSQYTFTGLRKDGSQIDIGVHCTLAVFGGMPAVIGMLQDISERRKGEERARQYVVQLEKAMFGTIDAVTAMVDLRDPYTSGHERRVGELAAAIGAEMGLSEDTVKGLRVIGHIHDVGKISVPAEILSKPGRLTSTEFELIKAHPRQGYDILKSVEFPWPVADAVLQHHERLDGSGYPQGLEGDAISLEARVIAVADTIEAMATHRPYRPARGIDEALKEIEGHSGKLYDAKAVAACLNLFRRKGYVLPA